MSDCDSVSPDLEDFAKWIRVEREDKRYRKRTYKRFTAWICEEQSPHGFAWWIVEDATAVVLANSDPTTGDPPASHDLVFTQARCIMTPAQIEAMLDPLIEKMYLVVQVRRTGEVPRVDP